MTNTSKIRDPIQGLRIKVRNYLRSQGVEGKFKTEVRRHPIYIDGVPKKQILIIGDVQMTSPVTDFEEYQLVFCPKR